MIEEIATKGHILNQYEGIFNKFYEPLEKEYTLQLDEYIKGYREKNLQMYDLELQDHVDFVLNMQGKGEVS